MDLQRTNRTGQQPCPYIGLPEDQETHFRYPHESNYCHKVSPAETITLVHQNRICLQDSHANCPVYQTGSRGSLPERLRRPEPVRRSAAALTLALASLTVVSILILMSTQKAAPGEVIQAAISTVTPVQFTPPGTLELKVPPVEAPVADSESLSEIEFANLSANGENEAPAAGATSTPLFMVVPQGATALSAGLPEFPTPGPLPGTPFVSSQKFVIHRVLPGETLALIGQRYQTDADVLRALNPTVALQTLLPGRLVVVAIGLTEIEDLPAFEILYLTRGRSLEDIAASFGVPLLALVTYNGLGNAEVVPAGRWLIIPETP